MDTVISKLTCQFDGMRTVAEHLWCIHPTAVLTDDDNKLHAHAQDLTMIYNQDSSAGFPQQLLAFRHIMMSKIESNATIKDLAELLIVKHSSIIMLSQF